jgi:phosphoribosylanthranilate isomerase
MSFLIKICGVTTPADAQMVVEAGADAVGLNFWPGSRRFVGPDANRERVVAAIPPGVLRFGVFVNAPVSEVLAQARRWGLDRIQLHGDEEPRDFAGVPAWQLVRAVRVRDAAALAGVHAWSADTFLLDAFVDGYGGGGKVAPWAAIADFLAAADLLAAQRTRPPRFLLAGGLHPGNVAEAIAATRPAGVDVASGVERAPGRKDPELVARFIAAARAAAAATAADRIIPSES